MLACHLERQSRPRLHSSFLNFLVAVLPSHVSIIHIAPDHWESYNCCDKSWILEEFRIFRTPSKYLELFWCLNLIIRTEYSPSLRFCSACEESRYLTRASIEKYHPFHLEFRKTTLFVVKIKSISCLFLSFGGLSRASTARRFDGNETLPRSFIDSWEDGRLYRVYIHHNLSVLPHEIVCHSTPLAYHIYKFFQLLFGFIASFSICVVRKKVCSGRSSKRWGGRGGVYSRTKNDKWR